MLFSSAHSSSHLKKSQEEEVKNKKKILKNQVGIKLFSNCYSSYHLKKFRKYQVKNEHRNKRETKSKSSFFRVFTEVFI